MKSINQFDYPTREAITFKNYSEVQYDRERSKEQQKNRYKQNLQYHMQIERNKVKQNQIKKKDQQNKKNKHKLAHELQRKKKQLQNLQILKKQAEQNQKKAHQAAKLKQEQYKIKKQQEYRRKKQFELNAANRFQQALKRLHQEKQQTNFKERLAEQRRRTNQEFQRIQRIKANKFKSYLQEKQKNVQEEQKVSFEEYKKTLGRSAYNKNTDYTKTCLHNPKIIVENRIEREQDAYQKGKLTAEYEREKSEERRRRNQENLRRSQQRGKQALLRMQRERDYMQFQRETEEQQKKYNLDRIEAGKKNQYIGVKPTTLQQMQENKKLRSQQEFDRMFFSKPLTVTENFNKTATKFDIIDNRMPKNKVDSFVSEQKMIKSKEKSYLREKEESQIPCVSDGKYSFEEPQYEEFNNKSQSRSHQQIQEQSQDYQNEEQIQDSRGHNMKNQWKQTGIPNQKFSNSPDLPRKPVNQFMKKQERKFQKQEQQKDSFNTDEMLRKYGLKKDSPPKKSNLKQPTQQKKRKVVELANICQNKDHSKEQLSYSQSQEEEDSLM